MTLSIDEYLVPAKAAQAEVKIKGSRFIASVERVTDKEEAEIRYEAYRKKYFNATHNCLAYRIDENIFRFYDDGEPSGTAGKPILQTLDGSTIQQILCVVTRYFGGTKLGTGGLIRAYSESARAVLAELKTKVIVKTSLLLLELRYDQEPLVRKFLNCYKGRIIDCTYLGQVKMEVAIPKSIVGRFSSELTEATQSTIKILAS
jgi:uncharacterized YigZ family protein